VEAKTKGLLYVLIETVESLTFKRKQRDNEGPGTRKTQLPQGRKGWRKWSSGAAIHKTLGGRRAIKPMKESSSGKMKDGA